MDSAAPVEMPYKYSLSVEYPSAEQATYICNALAVDEELHADRVNRVVTTQDKTLCVSFAAIDARMLRVSVNSFLEMTALATKTMDAF